MKTDHTLTAARLRELMRYEGGALYWRNPGPKHTSGPIGSRSGRRGRLQVEIDGVARYVHRLIWLHQRGEWPMGQIDHINGDMHDNRIENLRVVDSTKNAQNRRVLGVSYEKRNRRWRARIMVDGKSISLGYYATEREALVEYQRAKLSHHPAWASGIAVTT